MRKISSKHQEEKKKRKNQWIMSFVLIFILSLSVLGFGFVNFQENTENSVNTANSVSYNGFKFIEQNGFWSLNQDNFNALFRYNPKEVPRINSKLKNLNNYIGKPLYVYSEDSLAESEIYRNLQKSVERMQNACFEKKGCNENVPVKTCESNFIIIKENSNNKTSGIIQKNNCVFITGEKGNLTKLTDEFLFKLMRIEN